jgi:regulatory protein
LSGDSSDQPTAGEIRAFAYRLLGRREYSERELDQRIRRKWPQLESAPVEDLLEALVAENLLSDERFVESYVRVSMQKQQGPLRIRAGLRARGLPDSLVYRELERHSGEWTGLAIDWLQRQHAAPLDFEGRGKYYRRLLNRGFNHEQAMAALDSLL